MPPVTVGACVVQSSATRPSQTILLPTLPARSRCGGALIVVDLQVEGRAGSTISTGLTCSEMAGGSRGLPRLGVVMRSANRERKAQGSGVEADSWCAALRAPSFPALVLVGLAAAVLSAGCGTAAERRPGKTGAPVSRTKPAPPGEQTPSKQPSPATGEGPTPPKLKVVGRKVTLTWQEAGQPKLSASAQELTGNTLSGKAALRQVNADLYQKGKIVAKLTAPLVEADEKTRIVTATGGVTIVSTVPESNIRTVKADWIKWYSREDKIIGDGGISARGPVVSIDAAAFTADTRLRTIALTASPAASRAVIGKGR